MFLSSPPSKHVGNMAAQVQKFTLHCPDLEEVAKGREEKQDSVIVVVVNKGEHPFK